MSVRSGSVEPLGRALEGVRYPESFFGSGTSTYPNFSGVVCVLAEAVPVSSLVASRPCSENTRTQRSLNRAERRNGYKPCVRRSIEIMTVECLLWGRMTVGSRKCPAERGHNLEMYCLAP